MEVGPGGRTPKAGILGPGGLTPGKPLAVGGAMPAAPRYASATKPDNEAVSFCCQLMLCWQLSGYSTRTQRCFWLHGTLLYHKMLAICMP